MGNHLSGIGRSFLTALVLVLIAVGALGVPISVEAQSLEGEIAAGDLTFVLHHCDITGQTGLATFTTQGAAAGPFIGDFFEAGTVGRDSNGHFFLHSTFEIRDLMGALLVEGTKEFDGHGPSQFTCEDLTGPGVEDPTVMFLAEVGYTATIHAAGGAHDQGRALLNGDGFQINGVEEGGFTEEWLVSTEPPHDHVTGGGRVLNARTLQGVTFGFNARDTSRGPGGHCNVIDRAEGKHVKCLDVTLLIVEGNRATCFGNATVNGVPTTYRIDVDDLAEPGRNLDTFSITTATGYTAGGPLTEGNIQIH